jgi:hypothetical protein
VPADIGYVLFYETESPYKESSPHLDAFWKVNCNSKQQAFENWLIFTEAASSLLPSIDGKISQLSTFSSILRYGTE